MIRISDILLSLSSLVLIIVFVNFSLSPFSLLNFFGVVAGTASALCVLRGIKLLPSFFVSLIIVILIAAFIFDIAFNAEFIVFSCLAIALQSTWATQLTAKEMKDTAWLSSREQLIRFLIKLGPLSSLVSAFAILVLIATSNQEYQSGLLYAFLLSWSLSQLIAVFLLPLITFLSGLPQISKTKRLQVVVASSLAMIALSILFRVSHNDYQHKRQDEFNSSVNEIIQFVSKELNAIEVQLSSLNALFQASEYISGSEFARFSRHIFQPNSGVAALLWVPVVEKEQRTAFEQWGKVDNVSSFSLQVTDGVANPDKASEGYYAPVYFSYSNDSLQGLIGSDLFRDIEKKKAMFDSATLNTAVSTPPISVIRGDDANTGIYIFLPIFNAETINPFGGMAINEKENLDGFVVAVVHVASLFERYISTGQFENVNVSVQDITLAEPYFLYGQYQSKNNRLEHKIEQFEFNRHWVITITEATTWLAQPRNWLNWGVLIGCTLGGLLFQMLILLMTVYSSELNRKVSNKTRELIIQKEASEQQNRAKSKFLLNLSNELKVPLGALKGLVSKLRKEADKGELTVLADKIDSVSSNIEQSVETLADLSAIEAGNLLFQEQSFDFHLFLQQMETMLNVSTDSLLSNVSFVFDDSVPHFVSGDKIRLQQLVIALTHNGALIFNTDKLELSIKAHRHQQGKVTIFIVLTPSKSSDNSRPVPDDVAKQEFEHLTTSITMAKEICQRLGGAINLAPVAETGNYMLSASFKLALDSQMVNLDNLDATILDLSDKHIVIVSDDADSVMTINDYLIRHNCNVTVYEQVNENVLKAMSNFHIDAVFVECVLSSGNGFWLSEKIKQIDKFKQVPFIGIAPEFMSGEQYNSMQTNIDMFVNKPINRAELNHIINRYL